MHLSREHESWVISAHLRSDVPELITASVKGTVKFSDLRSMRSFKMLEIQKSPLSAFAVHPCAPILASGREQVSILLINSLFSFWIIFIFNFLQGHKLSLLKL